MRRALTPLARRALAAHAPSLSRHLSMSSPELFAKASRRLERVPPACVVVSPWDNPALARAPADAAELLIGNTLDELLAHGDDKLRAAECLLWVPPGDAGVLSALLRGGHLPALKWVHGFYAGVDGIAGFIEHDLAPAGLPLSNGRGAFSSSLAEYALAAALHFNKQVPRCQENRRARKWDKFVMDTLAGKTMGLVGAGDIAQHTARLAKAFGMRVVALRRNARKPDIPDVDLVLGPYDGEILPAHKAALLEQSDFVVCTLPGTAETRHFMSSAEFAAMKSDAIFISMGRGVAVDEAALHRALTTGQIAGAALDVFEVEPLPAESPLWDCDNLLLTAHNADFTHDYFDHGWRVWRANMEALQRGEPLATPVDLSAGY